MKLKSFGTALALTLCASATSQAVSIGLTDTFEDGTTRNWVTGLLGSPNPLPPVNVASGGPGGVNDNFLQVTSAGGQGPGSRLSVINFLNQWAGNYIDAGVSAISMDVRNLGATDLSLRLVFADPVAGPPVNVAFSSAPVFLPAGGGWTSVTFPVGLADLTGGLGTVEAALKNATEVRIYHSPAPNAPNPVTPIPAIVASLGIDNIQARAPDVGSTALLLGVAVAAMALVGRRPMVRM